MRFAARLTLKAIDEAIEADQGAAYRQHLAAVLPHMADAYRGADLPFRTHLGASVIGDECARKVWYGFRWATEPKFEGRMVRLFNRGHLEEARFIAALLTIGVQVYQQDAEGKQFRISDCEGHFGGSGDGVAMGIPDLPPGTPCLLEFKTHNAKSFAKLCDQGVRSAKPEHFVQMQIYMRKMQLPFALYGAVNKNDDSFYFEIVQADSATGDQYIDRARKIIYMQQPPEKINESPGWFACSWCPHKPVCHMDAAPAKNCRTCKWSAVQQDGTWSCVNVFNLDTVTLSKEQQHAGCRYYKRAF